MTALIVLACIVTYGMVGALVGVALFWQLQGHCNIVRRYGPNYDAAPWWAASLGAAWFAGLPVLFALVLVNHGQTKRAKMQAESTERKVALEAAYKELRELKGGRP